MKRLILLLTFCAALANAQSVAPFILSSAPAAPGGGAVTFDAETDSTWQGDSWPSFGHTVGVGANLLVLVIARTSTDATDTSAFVTWNGGTEALTFGGYYKDPDAAKVVEMWYLKNPTTGARRISFAMQDVYVVGMSASSWSGTNSTTPITGWVTGHTFSSSVDGLSISISSSTGEYVVDVGVGSGATTYTVNASQTQRMNATVSTTKAVSSTKAHPVTAMSWTEADALYWSGAAFRICP